MTLPAEIQRPVTLPGRLPGGLPHIPTKITDLHSQLELVLIEDKVANSQYLSTLASSGDTLQGSLPQAIFGARTPGLGAKKPAIWYTHNSNGTSDVKTLSGLTPAQAFRGMADTHGTAVMWDGGTFTPQNGGQVNPVLSDTVFNLMSQATAGTSRTLALQETLQNGDIRRFETHVTKAAHLTLLPPAGQVCRDERLNGVAGKLCTLRTIKGSSVARSGGDLMFTIRARVALPQARFRVGSQWHAIGDSVHIAEFANSHAIEVFFVPPSAAERDQWKAAHPQQKLSELVESGFYSASRLAKGDRFNLQLFGSQLNTRPSIVLSRLGLLSIEDTVTQRGYVTTLSGRSDQAIYGERQPQGRSRQAAWYLESGQLSPLFPLSRITHSQPVNLFFGVMDAQGQVSSGRIMPRDGQVNPVFSPIALTGLVKQPLGAQQELLATGQRTDGSRVEYRTSAVKAAALRLDRPSRAECHADKVEGINGQTCVLRTISGEHNVSSGGDIRFMIRSGFPLPSARFRVSNQWHHLGESVGLAEFARAKTIDVFIPKLSDLHQLAQAQWQQIITQVEMRFYSSSRQIKGDSFSLAMLPNSIRLPEEQRPDNGTSLNNTAVSVVSVSDAAIVEGKPLESTVTFSDVVATKIIYLKTTLENASPDDLNLKRVEIRLRKNGNIISIVDLSSGKPVAVQLPANAEKELTISIPTVADMVSPEPDETLILEAGFAADMHDAKSGTLAIMDKPSPKVISVGDSKAMEGAALASEILLTDKGAGHTLYLQTKLISAKEKDVDLTHVTVSFQYVRTQVIVDLSGGKIAAVLLPDVVDREVYVSIPTLKDISPNPDKTLELKGSFSSNMDNAQSGIQTIKDLDPWNIAQIDDVYVPEGTTAVLHVRLNSNGTLDGQAIYLKAVLSTATWKDADFDNVVVSYPNTNAPDDRGSLSDGNVHKVILPSNVGKNVDVSVYINKDAISDDRYMFQIKIGTTIDMAGSNQGTVIMQDREGDWEVRSVSDATVEEGKNAISTILLTEKDLAHQKIYLRTKFGSASESDVDLKHVKISYPGTSLPESEIDLSGGKMVAHTLPVGIIDKLSVSIPTIVDGILESPEKLYLEASNKPDMLVRKSGTIMITDSSVWALAKVDNGEGNEGENLTTHVHFIGEGEAGSEPLYLQAKLGTASENDMDLAHVKLSLVGGGNSQLIDLTGNKIASIMLPDKTVEVSIPLLQDNIDEPDEQFTLLASRDSKMSGSKQGTMTIHNRVAWNVASVADVTAHEGENAVSTVILTGDGDLSGNPLYLKAELGSASADDVELEHVTVRLPGSNSGTQLDLSGGKVVAYPLPAGLKKQLEIVLPLNEDQQNEPAETLTLVASRDVTMKEHQSGVITIINKTSLPTLEGISIAPQASNVVESRFSGDEPDVVIPYLVRVELSNMPVSSIGNYSKNEIATLLKNRTASAITVTAKVEGGHQEMNKNAVCAFTINNGKTHAAVPAYFGFAGNSSTWKDTPQNCTGEPIVLKDSQHPDAGGHWVKERGASVAGKASYTLKTRLGFKMNDRISGREIETQRDWVGSAKNDGTVTVELSLGN
ncbi:hypothetical protein [Plesiomonas sp.]|uniref:hypothetical protein n=1 Tax=Plesiomonas sp. TaxID=2486279 RepID=UPI003F3CEDC7